MLLSIPNKNGSSSLDGQFAKDAGHSVHMLSVHMLDVAGMAVFVADMKDLVYKKMRK